MKKLFTIFLCSLFLNIGSFLHAQDNSAVVAQAKADLQRAGVSLNGACGAVKITNLVVWRLRPQYGLLQKNGGYRAALKADGSCADQDQTNEPGFANDYIIDRSTGAGFDLLGDGGGANNPQWSGPEDAPEIVLRNRQMFREPIDPIAYLAPLTGDGSSESRPIIAMPISNIRAQVRGSALCYGRTDDDYWIGHADHAGQFSNGLWYSGWNAYWFARMAPNDTGSADPFLASKPAPSCAVSPSPPPVPPAPPVAPPVTPPAPPAVVIDYSAMLQQILASQQQLLASQNQLLVVAKDTNDQVTQLNRSFAQTIGAASKFLGKYVAPALAAYFAGKQLGK